jgi:hypothetical protein
MGVSLKTENEDSAGETLQERGSKGGRRGFTGTSRIVCVRAEAYFLCFCHYPNLVLGLRMVFDVILAFLVCSDASGAETGFSFFAPASKRLFSFSSAASLSKRSFYRPLYLKLGLWLRRY